MAACAINDPPTNKPTTRYYYDGQMSFEDDYTPITGGDDITVTRYALGARGIDGIETGWVARISDWVIAEERNVRELILARLEHGLAPKNEDKIR